MRPIDADAIKYNYYMMPGTTDSHKIAVSKDKIDAMPTIEAVPVRHIPDIKEVEKVIIDNLYVGDKKITDLIASGRLRLVGFCKECKHCFPPLACRVDGEVVQVTPDRCSIWNGYVEKNGWCYKFDCGAKMDGGESDG